MDNDTLSRKIRQKWHEMRSAAKKRHWGFDFGSLDDFGDFLISQNYEPGDILMRIDKTQPFSRYNCFVYKRGERSTLSDYVSKYAGIRRNINKELVMEFDRDVSLGNRYFRILTVSKKEGVEVEWKTFEEFVKWVDSIKDKKGKFLVRKDISKGFTSENCIWSHCPSDHEGRQKLSEEDIKEHRYRAYRKWVLKNKDKVKEYAKKWYRNKLSRMTAEELRDYKRKNSERAREYYEKTKAKRLNSN